MLTLSTDERRALRARAHPLKPVVMIAQNGLTDAVLKEIELALTSHELRSPPSACCATAPATTPRCRA